MVGRAGDILDVVIDGEVRLVTVVSPGTSKLQAVDQHGRRHAVSPRHILIQHREQVEAHQAPSALGAFVARVEKVSAEIDTVLLWESVVESEREWTAEELAELYFGERDCCRASAVLRAVGADRLRFRTRGGLIQPRERVQVEAQLLAEQRRREKEKRRLQIRDWLAAVLAGGAGDAPKPPEAEPQVLRRLEDFLLQRQPDPEVESWLDSLDPDLTPRLAAYEVLAALGRLPAEADPLLLAAGIDPRFSPAAVQRAEALAVFSGSPEREDFSSWITWSIDDEETVEIDDAFSFTFRGDDVVLLIHVADLTPFVEPGDPLDTEGRSRISSVYLPQTTVRMLPERLSCNLGSLQEDELRPVLSLEVVLDSERELKEWRFVRAQTKVHRRWSYDEVDQLLESAESDQKESEDFRRLLAVADRLASRRLERGGLRIRRPELKILVRGESIEVKVLDPNSPARRLVSEWMILTNHLAAAYARASGLPLIFRSQPAPGEPIQVPESYDPVRLQGVFNVLERSRLGLSAESHWGLGLDAYTQITSPLRRYCDMVVQRQIVAHLGGGRSVYTPEELAEVIGLIQAVEGDLRAAERKATRYYLLKYLAQLPSDQVFRGVVIRDLQNGQLVETKDLFVRGLLLREGDPLALGTELDLRVQRLDPERNILVFRAVSEP
ncbi:MAG TPA: RNB domain-containing ribonuclease [Acidobacteriota bacterium]|nr:RNB domain-containing ribonuclease [Acidobacteriota bacterium]